MTTEIEKLIEQVPLKETFVLVWKYNDKVWSQTFFKYDEDKFGIYNSNNDNYEEYIVSPIWIDGSPEVKFLTFYGKQQTTKAVDVIHEFE